MHGAVRRRRATTWLTYSFLLAVAVVFLFPFVIAIVTSFKTDPDATANPLSLSPSPATGAAYHELFHSQDFLAGSRTRRS